MAVVPNSIADIVRRARIVLDDMRSPYLWQDDQLIEYIADGQEDLARDAYLIQDSSTAAVCQIAIDTTNISYALDPRVVYIVRAKLYGSDKFPDFALAKHTRQFLDGQFPGWELRKAIPWRYCLDYVDGEITFECVSTDAGTLQLIVYRMPLVRPTVVDSTLLDIAPKHIPLLLQYVRYRAYQKHDADANDDKASADALVLYTDGKTKAKSEVIRQRTGNTSILARKAFL